MALNELVQRFRNEIMDPNEAVDEFNLALKLNPECPCIKKVPGWIIIELNNGTKIKAYTINGLEDSSPASLHFFSPLMLKAIAQAIPDSSTQTAILAALNRIQSDTPINCKDIYRLSDNHPVCLKGLNWELPQVKSRLPSKEFCPSSISGGCAERVLISWLPHLTSLGCQVEPHERLSVHQVHFFDPESPPAIEYSNLNNSRPITANPQPCNNGPEIICRITLGTQFLPCVDCAQAIADLCGQYRKTNIVLGIAHPSRHNNGNEYEIDYNDLRSLRILTHPSLNNLGLQFFNPNTQICLSK